MKLGIVTIRNDGSRASPTWSAESQNGTFLFDTPSLDEAAELLRLLIAEGNHTFGEIHLELEEE